jgi:hypothetical protein
MPGNIEGAIAQLAVSITSLNDGAQLLRYFHGMFSSRGVDL